MTQPTSVTLRLMDADDDDVHVRVYAAAAAAQWAGSAIDAEQHGVLVEIQSMAQVHQYRERYPLAEWYVLELASELAGRLIIDHQPTAIHVIDLVLLEHAQGQGIGAEVLRGLHATASDRGVVLTASVLAGNAGARSLYERLGFRELAPEAGDPGLSIALEWPPDP